MEIEGKKREIVFTKKQIDRRVAELGQEISMHYKDKNLMIISLLKGSFIFTADLVRCIELDLRIEFMTTSMYGNNESNTGKLKVIQDVEGDLSEYDILIVDDITDSALTMTGVIEILKKRNPRSIKSCVLLDKPSRRRTEYIADYIGFTVPDKFIVGYGLNYGDYFRNVNHVFAFIDKEEN